MVFNGAISSLGLKKIKVSKVVLVSGLLTFMFLIELSIGLRCLGYVFRLWYVASRIPSDGLVVSWTLCVASVFLCVVSFFSINSISAMWERKQRQEDGKEKNAVAFALHLLIGGMVWRYVSLWFIDCETRQKKEALLLTFVKFLFSQFFTIPMIIVHVSLSESLDEVIYDICSVLCISVNLLLTCAMSDWCKSEVNELKNWKFETIDLIPLIFCKNNDNSQTSSTVDEDRIDTEQKDTTVNNASSSTEESESDVENALVRTIVLFQTFCFTFGRLLALGILLKLAGIYAMSILFLQLLISVVYLKFQVPFLVSDSLPKWRQLTRLAFMSYILIFEWHLYRDPKTGYDFTSNMKHSLLYYSIVTVESAFYFVTWAITESYASTKFSNHLNLKFSRNIILIGIMSLVFSLLMHFFLLLWQSRRLSAFVDSVQLRYQRSKLGGSYKSPKRKNATRKSFESNKSEIEISNPIPKYEPPQESKSKEESTVPLEKRNSYKDLRDPIDEEIEIYSRKNTRSDYSSIEEREIGKQYFETKENYVASGTNNCVAKEISELKRKTADNTCIKLTTSLKVGFDAKVTSAPATARHVTVPTTENDSNHDDKCLKNKTNAKSVEILPETELTSASKTKMVKFSESINENYNKLSLMSKKLSGKVWNQVQKRKERLQNYRNSPDEQITDTNYQKNGTNFSEKEAPSLSPESSTYKKPSQGDNMSSEEYFIGDSNTQREHEKFHKGDETYCSVSDAPQTDSVLMTSEDYVDSDYVPPLDENYSFQTVELHEANCYVKRQCKSEHKLHTCESSEEINVYEENSNTEEDKNGTEAEDFREERDQTEELHADGKTPCPCYLCKMETGGTLRRRSFSVPPEDRKREHFLSNMISEDLPGAHSAVHSPSNSSSVRVNMNKEVSSGVETEESNTLFLPKFHLRSKMQNLSLVSLDNRDEHFV